MLASLTTSASAQNDIPQRFGSEFGWLRSVQDEVAGPSSARARSRMVHDGSRFLLISATTRAGFVGVNVHRLNGVRADNQTYAITGGLASTVTGVDVGASGVVAATDEHSLMMARPSTRWSTVVTLAQFVSRPAPTAVHVGPLGWTYVAGFAGAAPSRSPFLMAFNDRGVHQWTRPLTRVSNLVSGSIPAISADAAGNVVVGGHWSGPTSTVVGRRGFSATGVPLWQRDILVPNGGSGWVADVQMTSEKGVAISMQIGEGPGARVVQSILDRATGTTLQETEHSVPGTALRASLVAAPSDSESYFIHGDPTNWMLNAFRGTPWNATIGSTAAVPVGIGWAADTVAVQTTEDAGGRPISETRFWNRTTGAFLGRAPFFGRSLPGAMTTLESGRVFETFQLTERFGRTAPGGFLRAVRDQSADWTVRLGGTVPTDDRATAMALLSNRIVVAGLAGPRVVFRGISRNGIELWTTLATPEATRVRKVVAMPNDRAAILLDGEFDDGALHAVVCLNATDGRVLWTRTFRDEDYYIGDPPVINDIVATPNGIAVAGRSMNYGLVAHLSGSTGNDMTLFIGQRGGEYSSLALMDDARIFVGGNAGPAGQAFSVYAILSLSDMSSGIAGGFTMHGATEVRTLAAVRAEPGWVYFAGYSRNASGDTPFLIRMASNAMEAFRYRPAPVSGQIGEIQLSVTEGRVAMGFTAGESTQVHVVSSMGQVRRVDRWSDPTMVLRDLEIGRSHLWVLTSSRTPLFQTGRDTVRGTVWNIETLPAGASVPRQAPVLSDGALPGSAAELLSGQLDETGNLIAVGYRTRNGGAQDWTVRGYSQP